MLITQPLLISDETDPRHSHLSHMGLHHDSSKVSDSSAGIPIPPSKPKIWSLADTAVCKTPPPPSHHAHLQQQQQQQQQQQLYAGQQQLGHSVPHSSYGGLTGAASVAASAASWGYNFDPTMMRLNHHRNMLGMGYMGLPPAASGGHVTASPGLNSDGVQSSSNDTPPHTPPTVKNQFGLYNGLHNGYSQMSPSSGGREAEAAAAASAASKASLMFNGGSSFKMM